jgi:hypothetical protein
VKCAAYLTTFFKDPTKAVAPFNLAWNTTETKWDWFERPGNELHHARFNQIMAGQNMLYGPDRFLEGKSHL